MEKIKNCGKHEKRSRLADLPAVGRAVPRYFLSLSSGGGRANLYGALKALACKWV